MARITSYIPEPKQEYDVENQRQILRAVDTIKNELNFSDYNFYLQLLFALNLIFY